jgi:hypothetical protein
MRASYSAGQNTVVIVRSAHQGVLAGLFGCVFGLLGIFTWGLIFVPLSAICALVGSFRGIAGRSITGIGCSLLAGMLAVFGFVVSPSLWVLTGAALLAQHVSTPENATKRPSTAISHSPTRPPAGYVDPDLPQSSSSDARRSCYTVGGCTPEEALREERAKYGIIPAINQLADQDCFMGECFREFVVSLTKEKSGLVSARTRVEHYCGASSPSECTSIQRDMQALPDEASYKIQCETPGGYVEWADGHRLPEPEHNPPHATRAARQLWGAICSMAAQR